MFIKILCVLKVLFRNGETLISIIQEMYQEIRKETGVGPELQEMEDKILTDEEASNA